MFAFVFVFVFVLRVNWCGVSCVLELCLCFVLGSWCVTFRCVDVRGCVYAFKSVYVCVLKGVKAQTQEHVRVCFFCTAAFSCQCPYFSCQVVCDCECLFEGSDTMRKF